MHNGSFSVRLLVMALAGGVVTPANAQENSPSRPVRFIAPYPPGGSSDVLARAVMMPERSPALPGVPTMMESGVKDPLPTQWWGVA